MPKESDKSSYVLPDEAKIVGPYPTWEVWRHSLYSRLGVDKDNSEIQRFDSIIHEWYVFRRRVQKIDVFDDGKKKFLDDFNDKNGDIIDENPLLEKALAFITDNTEILK
jgi:hypothetical protein